MKTDWEPRRRIEENYRRALKALMDRFVSFLDPLDITDPAEIMERMSAFFGADAFRDLAQAAASRMVTGLFQDGARTWKEAAREGMRGNMIYKALWREMQGPVGARVGDLITENARLIGGFNQIRIAGGRTLADEIVDYIKGESFKGRRAADIAKDLARQYPKVTEGRINLIARTEVSRASTALTRARAEDLDLDWYVWRTAKDARTRKAHRHLDGVLVAWNEPPSPEALLGIKSTLGDYHAGDCPNCRCYPEPMLRLDRVDWPHRAFYDGRIQMMTRSRFARISGLERKLAA